MRTRTPFSLAALSVGGAALALAAFAASQPRDLMLYNHSASMPIGFYLRSDAPIARGAIVTIRARDAAPEAAAARDFDRPGDRFLKRVAALGGDEVCADGLDLRINGRLAAQRRAQDSTGAPLAGWRGCRRLAAGEALLLGDSPDSFDGRYWGAVPQAAIEGVWRPL